MDKKELQEKVEALRPWHHDIDLGNGVRTGRDNVHAYDPNVRWKVISKYLPNDMSGKSVLDLGCNSGFFSVQCKLRGAEKVVGVDSFANNVKQAELISEHFKVKCELVHQDAHIYTLTTEDRFDYVIFSRVFYHLKYPNLVLDRLAEMTKLRLIMLTEVIGPEGIIEPKENYNLDETSILETPAFPRMVFIEKAFSSDYSNWWFPNESCIFSLIRASGMKVAAHPNRETFVAEPARPLGKRVSNNIKLVFPA